MDEADGLNESFENKQALLHDGLQKCKEAILKCAQSENPEAVVAEIFGLQRSDGKTPVESSTATDGMSPAFSTLLEIVEGLITKSEKLDEEVKKNNSRCNDIEQYSRKNSMLMRKMKNIPKTNGIEFAKWVANELNQRLRYLDHPISYLDIDAAHPLPNKTDPQAPPTVVIVKFVSRNTRNDVYYKKKQLKFSNDNVSFTDHLASYNAKLSKAKAKFGLPNAWSDQCRIFVFRDGKKVHVKSVEEVDGLSVPEDHLKNCEIARKNYQEKRSSSRKKHPRQPLQNQGSNHIPAHQPRQQQSGPSFGQAWQSQPFPGSQYQSFPPNYNMYNPNYFSEYPAPDPNIPQNSRKY